MNPVNQGVWSVVVVMGEKCDEKCDVVVVVVVVGSEDKYKAPLRNKYVAIVLSIIFYSSESDASVWFTSTVQVLQS